MPGLNNWFSHRIVYRITNAPSILIQSLSFLEISGLEEHADGITVYYQSDTLTKEIKVLCDLLQLNAEHQITSAPDQNWNAVWESSFEPVQVDDFCIVYAHFHEVDTSLYQHSIQITPQMSFGTGHHATTRMMVRMMKKIEFNKKSVLDFGTGTGILAILSKMLGAQNVVGIDNVSWAVENAQENAKTNHVGHINFFEANHARVEGQQFDIMLVNIIRKVIFENLDILAQQTKHNGLLLLSGFLRNDRQKVIYESRQRGFHLKGELIEEQWVCQLYHKVS